MTCTLTDGARKFRWWCYYRPTRPHLEGPSRLKLTYSTRLAGLVEMGICTDRCSYGIFMLIFSPLCNVRGRPSIVYVGGYVKYIILYWVMD